MSDIDESISKRLRSRAFKKADDELPARKRSRKSKTTNKNDEELITQDSLLVLNDDCLRTIFKKIQFNIHSLCDLAEVCTRFERLATGIFPRQFSKKKIFVR